MQHPTAQLSTVARSDLSEVKRVEVLPEARHTADTAGAAASTGASCTSAPSVSEDNGGVGVENVCFGGLNLNPDIVWSVLCWQCVATRTNPAPLTIRTSGTAGTCKSCEGKGGHLTLDKHFRRRWMKGKPTPTNRILQKWKERCSRLFRHEYLPRVFCFIQSCRCGCSGFPAPAFFFQDQNSRSSLKDHSSGFSTYMGADLEVCKIYTGLAPWWRLWHCVDNV